MTQSSISTWFKFALQQMAAESYLDQLLTGKPIREILSDGNNDTRVIQPDPVTGELPGKTRFTDVLADRFLSTNEIVDHHANDATGFSATLMRDTTTGEYTLSFRSLEYQHQVDGGDWERDGRPGAAGEIFDHGFAFAQLVSLERYYRELKANPIKLPPGAVLNVTGYSLGGHLATVFTELHDAEVAQTVTFNGAGRGRIVEQGQIGQPEVQSIRRLLQDLETQILVFDPAGSRFQSGAAGNIYAEEAYDQARTATQAQFATFGALSIGSTGVGEAQTGGAFDKITQLVGKGLTGTDAFLVANSGVHAPSRAVLIEGQPQIEGLDEQGQLQFGNAHSITLLVDSLAVQELFACIDPDLTQIDIEAMLQAASNARADTVALPVEAHTAEGDTLEQALDALRALFVPTDPDPQTDFDDDTGGFGNVGTRNEFYNHIEQVRAALNNHTYSIEPLVQMTGQGGVIPRLTVEELKVAAQDPGASGQAYRYALRALNPFVVVGVDYEGLGHTANGQLTLYNSATGVGETTDQYLYDRSAFLLAHLDLTIENFPAPLRPSLTHYRDMASGVEVSSTLPNFQREYLFGGHDAETLEGHELTNDHLYGGDGVDSLLGYGGNDYLQGEEGNDTLDGGSGADRMVGGRGNDAYIVDDLGDQVIEGLNNGSDTVQSSVTFTLGANVEDLTLTGSSNINGAGNELDNLILGNSGVNRLKGGSGSDRLEGGNEDDILLGGSGDGDLLEGGTGFDTYIYNAGDGIDRIEDSDAQGQIIFDGRLLQGGIRRAGDAVNTYTSLDGQTNYLISGTDLIVNGVLTVNENFQSGQFGIRLTDVTEASYDNGYEIITRVGGPGNDTFGILGLVNNVIHYGDGDDVDLGERGNDQLFGENGNDSLQGDTGNDRLFGGAGNDRLWGDNELPSPSPSFNVGTDAIRGDDSLDGGAGDDELVGGWGNDILLGGEGTDTLWGDSLFTPQETFTADDYLDGGEGADELHGLAGNDVLVGGAGNDSLFGEEGDDIKDGGSGDDLLVGGGGADTLSGGDGADQLAGDYANATGTNEGDDTLDGGAGNDLLVGGGGNDVLFGGADNDLLAGDDGNDFLDGGDGADELHGGLGIDTLFGGSGEDLLFGQEDDDSLFGDDGVDELQGGAGNDLLTGDAGNDRLFGQDGHDTLYGDEGDDALAGNEGNDGLVGGIGNDVVEGGRGDDTLDGGTGSDTYLFNVGDGQDTITDMVLPGEGNLIQFGSGITLQNLTFSQDQVHQTLTIQVGAGGDSIRLLDFNLNTFDSIVQTLAFSDGSQVALAGLLPLPSGFVQGTDASEVIRTSSNDDVIDAGAGNDVIDAGGGNDTLLGGIGNDLLVGGSGHDVLDGGDGNDQLTGGLGNDTFLFGGGSGQDTVEGLNPGDTILVTAGIRPDDVTVVRSGSNLILNVAETTNGLTLNSFFDSPASQAGQVQFADGTLWDTATLIQRARMLTGTEGSDVLQAFDDGNFTLRGLGNNDILASLAGSDVLDGGQGNDHLSGGAGNDTYRVNPGDGLDTISDTAEVGEPNAVVFGTGISSDTATFRLESSGLVLRTGTPDDGLSFGFVNTDDIYGPHSVDQFHFADGTALTYAQLVDRGIEIPGTEFDDFLSGTNVRDLFVGGFGNDTLAGGAGNDQYVFHLGDGVDAIQDLASTGEGNELIFGPGISSASLTLSWQAPEFGFGSDQLVIRTGATGDAITLDQFNRSNVLGSHAVESYVFDDGTVLPYSQLIDRGFDLTGTEANESIAGTNVMDRLSGLGGNDVLQGGAGNDMLDGGAGNDQLNGGMGDDAYLFGQGAGRDRIIDLGGTHDAIQLASDIAPSDLQVTKSGKDIVLTITGTTDRLTLSQFFTASVLQIDEVRFGDGTVWDAATLTSKAQQDILGTDNAEMLTGTDGDEVLRGLGGDDQLTGLGGDDVLDGGAGADQLLGGIGHDTYLVDDTGDAVIEGVSEGTDTVQTSVAYSLAANVENVTLTGTLAINGTGNALDNVLTGNSAANVLTGGAGNDVYVVGAGDTVVENFNEGIDTVQSDLTYTLGAHFENLTLTGSTSIDGTGNDLGNVLAGNSSVNVLVGGLGNDTYIVGAGDTIVERADEGVDTVKTNQSYQVGANVENLVLLETGRHYPQAWADDAGAMYGSVPTLRGVGNELDNVLIGNSTGNVLEGWEGNDTLDGGAGADLLRGGAGQDTYLFGRGSGQDIISDGVVGEVDTIQMASGITPDDLIVGRASFPSPQLFMSIGSVDMGDTLTIHYSSLDDLLTKQVRFADGTLWDGATLLAKSAPPLPNPGIVLNGDSADDVLTGGSGDDQLSGLGGDDQLDGQVGNDTLDGGPGSDVLMGGAGRDRLSGGSGLDVSGNDILIGGDGNDDLFGSGGNNDLEGGAGNDHLVSRDGNDLLNGGSGNDTLQAGAGNDRLDGGSGDDQLQGDAGADIYVFGRGYGHDFASASDEDTVRFAPDVLPADVVAATDGQFLMLRINGTDDQFKTFFPGEQSQAGVGHVEFSDGTVWDRAYLRAAAGFIGTDGSDFLDGTHSPESDTLIGNRGDDTYAVDALDTVVETSGEGIDLIHTLVDNYELPAHVENLLLGDQLSNVIGHDVTLRPILGTGNEEDNVLFGNSTDNILDGGGGNDTLVGGIAYESDRHLGDGSDILIGGTGDDVLKPFGSIVGGLTTFDQAFFGTDLLLGGSGNDTYVLRFEDTFNVPGSLSNAMVLELPNEGSDTVVAGTDYILPSNVENLLMLGGTRGTGNGLDNVLIGSVGVNVLEGREGNDTLMAGFGQVTVDGPSFLFRALFDDQIDDQEADTLIGGVGHDTYLSGVADIVVEQADEGIDTVWTSSHYELGNNVENLTLRGTAAINGTGNALDNVLTGNSAANLLMGDAGHDRLYGGAGHDTYVFNLGDGIDAIEDLSTIGEGNRIRFGSGITQADLTFSQNQRILTIQVGAGGDVIRLMNFDSSGANGSLVTGTLEFADGSTTDLNSLLVPAATDGDDLLTGGNGNDVIDALAGNDVVDAGAGNDTVMGNVGNDTLIGGPGNDTYVFNPGDGIDTIIDTALTGEGNVLTFGSGILPMDLSLGLGSLVIRIGTDGDAIHIQDFDPNDVLGAHAIDTFHFANGTALTYGQLIDRGFDLAGTSGDDSLIGTNVMDRINGLAGDDMIQAGNGSDVLDGGIGADILAGGGGDDTYLVDNAGDMVTESADQGIDTVLSSVTFALGMNIESLTLTGSADINATGNTLDNVLLGNNGNNILDSLAGTDTMIGRAGDDTYVRDQVGDTVTESFNEGVDTVLSSVTYTLGANVEHLILTETDAINGTGNDLNNTLIGNGAVNVLDGGIADDTLLGGAGDDTLDGGIGTDRLDGGTGTDAMIGGTGDDTYVVDNSSDMVTENVNEGIDSVESMVTYTLGANVENLTLTGAAVNNGTGNALDNMLIGNSANNTLNGGAGNDRLDGAAGSDTMLGGTGDDTYVINQAGDVVTESLNQGTDTVESAITYTLGSNVENLMLTGLVNINGTGNFLNNVLIGNAGANALDGGSGNDVLDGGEGNDALMGGSGNDQIIGGNGNDTLDAGSGGDQLVGGEGNDLLSAGSGNDTLDGGAGIDTLDGGSGDDRLAGGQGNDRLMGGSGNDLYQFNRTEGQDTIQDVSGTADRLLFGGDINPLDIVISRQANDLRLVVHGTADQVTIQNWYNGSLNQVEILQAGNGQQLVNTKVDQLLQAMAAFTQQSGMTWDQAIDQRPQDVQNVLAANWQ